MIRSNINKIKITAQHIDKSSSDPEAVLGFAVVVELFADDPVSLKLLVKVEDINLLPQLPQNIATSLFS